MYLPSLAMSRADITTHRASMRCTVPVLRRTEDALRSRREAERTVAALKNRPQMPKLIQTYGIKARVQQRPAAIRLRSDSRAFMPIPYSVRAAGAEPAATRGTP